MRELIAFVLFFAVVLFLSRCGNEKMHSECIDRGGKVITRPTELLDSCLESAESGDKPND